MLYIISRFISDRVGRVISGKETVFIINARVDKSCQDYPLFVNAIFGPGNVIGVEHIAGRSV